MSKDDQDITMNLLAWRQGDTEAGDVLFRLVFAELRVIAARQMRGERPLRPTALVNDAYKNLGGQHSGGTNRSHFFGVAAQMMNCI